MEKFAASIGRRWTFIAHMATHPCGREVRVDVDVDLDVDLDGDDDVDGDATL